MSLGNATVGLDDSVIVPRGHGTTWLRTMIKIIGHSLCMSKSTHEPGGLSIVMACDQYCQVVEVEDGQSILAFLFHVRNFEGEHKCVVKY